MRKFLALPVTKPLGIVLITWAVASIIYGVFNQLHATRFFFGVFAYSFGCYERYRREHQIDKVDSKRTKSHPNMVLANLRMDQSGDTSSRSNAFVIPGTSQGLNLPTDEKNQA